VPRTSLPVGANLTRKHRLLQVAAEKRGLREEFDANFKIVTDIEENEPTSKTGAMVDFFVRVRASFYVLGVVICMWIVGVRCTVCDGFD
jgi:hypothetical protein